MNHYYDDVSNLNAPYDAVSLQGLGQSQVDNSLFPWGEAAPATKALQDILNTYLDRDGGCRLLSDGVLGARTCGAMEYYGNDGPYDVCGRNGASPGTPPTIPCPGSTPAPASDVVVVAPEKKKVPGWMIGVGLGVAAIAVAMMLSKKKRRN